MAYVTTIGIPIGEGHAGVDIADIDVEVDLDTDTYTLRVAGRLLEQRPEAVTAAIQLAMLELRHWARPPVA